jgi:hypothetical protein
MQGQSNVQGLSPPSTKEVPNSELFPLTSQDLKRMFIFSTGWAKIPSLNISQTSLILKHSKKSESQPNNIQETPSLQLQSF